MNREILFRGKRLDGSGQAYGDLSYHVHNGEVYVFPGDGFDNPDRYEVDPATVGQYTGLNDKNGKRIFEGDIVSVKDEIGEIYRFKVMFGKCGGGENVEHDVGYMGFYFEEVAGEIPAGFMLRNDPLYWLNEYDYEVIGNVFDNPELLEGTEC